MNSSIHRPSYRIPIKLRLVIAALDIIALVLALAAAIAVPYFF